MMSSHISENLGGCEQFQPFGGFLGLDLRKELSLGKGKGHILVFVDLLERSLSVGLAHGSDVRLALEVFTALGRSRECPAVARTLCRKKTPQMINLLRALVDSFSRHNHCN